MTYVYDQRNGLFATPLGTVSSRYIVLGQESKEPVLTLQPVQRFTDPSGRVVKTIFRGRLVNNKGRPIPYVSVFAVGFLNGWNQQLGNTQTNVSGFYEITSLLNLDGGSVKTVYHGYSNGKPVPETSSEMQTLPQIKRS